MENWLLFFQSHADKAHWAIFVGALLAGFNIPISIDLLMVASAVLAATIIPSHLFHLYGAIFLGCLFSAWISFWVGRKCFPLLQKWRFFMKVVSEKRMARVKGFYEKWGIVSFLLGRFIPFGVRNLLFMSSGMSRLSFPKFMLWDACACLVWSSLCFSIYYTLGRHLDQLLVGLKWAHLLLFVAFGVTVIGIIWYKKHKNARGGNV